MMGAVRTLFDGVISISYGQFYLLSDEVPDLTEALAGQSNGLCAAGVAGALVLLTGTHEGRVRLTVEVHEAEPPAAGVEWEEVVEAPFAPTRDRVALSEWGGKWQPLDLAPATYRVRYCVTGMARRREAVGGDFGVLAEDRYLLMLWPEARGAARPDAVLRVTNSRAAVHHRHARGLPPPPTAQERAEAERVARLERERRAEEARLAAEARRWGGRPPSERLRGVVGNVSGIALLDRDLVDLVAEADPATQRRVAHWAARHAYTYAGIADVDWIVPAWDALERGDPLPEACVDTAEMWRRLGGGGGVIHAEARILGRSAAPDPIEFLLAGPVAAVPMALPALPAAALPDPLQAALEALWAAATAYGPEVSAFLALARDVLAEYRRASG
jgi:hypothetical protein